MKEASIISAIAGLIKVMDGWEFSAVLLVLILMPVLVTYLITRSNRELREKIQEDRIASEKRFETLRETSEERFESLRFDSEKRFEALRVASEKRFEAVVHMYENNVELVERYEKVAGELTTMMHLSTKAMTKLVDQVELSLKIMMEKDLSLKLLQATNNNKGNQNG